MTATPPRAALDMLCFLPARNFDLSQRFYLELGFERVWSDGKLARFQIDGCGFMLQDFYVKAHAHNCMMHLRVACLDDGWRHVTALELGRRYGCRVEPPALRPDATRDFTLSDPSGVTWRMAQSPRFGFMTPPEADGTPRRRGDGLTTLMRIINISV